MTVYLAAPVTFTLPRHVWAEPSLREQTARAIAEWDACRSGVFVLTDDSDAEVKVVSTPGRTWVAMPLNGPASTVYVGNDGTDIDFWLAHELGHTLNLADHVFPGTDLTGYVNAQSTEDGYRGVMSYAATRDQWFGPDDVLMLASVFPLAYRVVIPEVQ